MTSRRVRIYVINRHLLAGVLRGGRWWRSVEGFPKDASVLSSTLNPMQDEILVKVSSASFDDVPEGEVIPRFYPLWEVRSDEIPS